MKTPGMNYLHTQKVILEKILFSFVIIFVFLEIMGINMKSLSNLFIVLLFFIAGCIGLYGFFIISKGYAQAFKEAKKNDTKIAISNSNGEMSLIDTLALQKYNYPNFYRNFYRFTSFGIGIIFILLSLYFTYIFYF